ncbi:MAG: HD domain-containing phosphohydrolase [Acidobacteriota bacterium]
MSEKNSGFLAKLRLRHLLFLFLIVFGVFPLIFTTVAGVLESRPVLEREEQVNLSRQAESLATRVGDDLELLEAQLQHLGQVLTSIEDVLDPESEETTELLNHYLRGFVGQTRESFASRVVLDAEQGLSFGATFAPYVLAELDRAAQQSLADGRSVYSLTSVESVALPQFSLTIPLTLGAGETERGVALQGVATMEVSAREGEDVFLLDISESGQVLWAANTRAELIKRAVAQSTIVRDFLSFSGGAFPVFEYDMRVGSANRKMIGQISRLADTRWAILIQKPKSAAYRAVTDLVRSAALSGLLMLLVALVFGTLASRVISSPIQQLASTSQDIAAGNFGQRVQPAGFGTEFVELAESFNQMSGHVEDYVGRLQKAAAVNRELFLGTIRALLAAIEAKEPYTRGHSERVASYSQAIARHLNRSSREFHEQLWVAGLLHDVGKIGIEDRVLNKGDVLTEEEFSEMKQHPVIGAEIMSAIEQLKPLLPAIRWHHERWNGQGYPDGLAGESIPLMARIVAVADTFDAVTTQRVYQDPCTAEEALEIIERLNGTGFDPRVVEAFMSAYDSGAIQVLPVKHKARPSRDATDATPVHT